MDHPPSMGVRQCVGNIGAVSDRLCRVHAHRSRKPSREGLAAYEGERQRRLFPPKVSVEQGHDVRVIEPAGGIGFGRQLAA